MARCVTCGWHNPEGRDICEKCGELLTFDVFISYSRKDYVDDSGNVLPDNLLSKIKDRFKANNISYWFDEEGIFSGDEFASVLTRAIRNSRIFLFVSSVNSNQSKWTSNEISTAIEFGKTIIPFRIDDSPYNDSVMMKIISYDYVEGKDEEKALSKLIRAIRHHLPEKQYLGGNRWRNIDVPEGAKGTVVSFIMDDEVQKHEFLREDFQGCSREDVHEVIEMQETTSDDCKDMTSTANPCNKRGQAGMFSMNTRYKGCTLYVMVALGLLVIIRFFPIARNTNSPTEDGRQIVKVNKSNEDGRTAIPPTQTSPEPSYTGSTGSHMSEDTTLSSSQKSENRLVAKMLGEEAYDALLRGDYPAAESLSLNGLRKDSTQHWIATNLAVALLFQGKTTEAEKIYRQYKNELKKSFLDDFTIFEKAGVIPEERKKDVEHIRQLLTK